MFDKDASILCSHSAAGVVLSRLCVRVQGFWHEPGVEQYLVVGPTDALCGPLCCSHLFVDTVLEPSPLSCSLTTSGRPLT